MDRKQKTVAGLDLANLVGAEIGALDRPLVTKAEGKIINVDYMSTAELHAKYKDDPNVNKPNIVDVDVVTGGGSLTAAMGDTRVDYIIASHVIEHVPDLIGWLEELRGLLKPGGELRLIVPDRRFTFDYLRQETRLADVLNAIGAKVPTPQTIVDYMYLRSKVDCVQAWQRPLDVQELVRDHTIDEALVAAREAVDKGVYHDVHCWVFTPASLASLFEELAALGFLKLSCESFHDTAQWEIEFFLTMRECLDPKEAAASWRRMRQAPLVDLDPLKQAIAQLKELVAGRVARVEELEVVLAAEQQRTAKLEARLTEVHNRLGHRLVQLQDAVSARDAHVRHLEETIGSMNASTSWRLTAPLRSLRNAVLNLKGGKP